MAAPLLTLTLPRHPSAMPYPWLFFAMTGIIFLGVLILTVVLLRRMMASSESGSAAEKAPIPRAENEPAFMTASMQAVIQRLREQEKELERLHKIERERAESTARFSEEVTRNMPAGLLVVGANGLITSSNPAAEQALGIKTLAFRRYSEALGDSSKISALIEQCLSHGTVFRREQAAHIAPDGTHRELGVTISPIRRGQEKATGAICLLSDLTELASLQNQMQMRENLAALGELAGFPHRHQILGHILRRHDELLLPWARSSAVPVTCSREARDEDAPRGATSTRPGLNPARDSVLAAARQGAV